MQASVAGAGPRTEWTPEALERYRKTQRESSCQTTRRTHWVPPNPPCSRQALDLSDSDFSYGDLPKWLRRVANGSGRKATIGKRLAGQLEESVLWSSKASASTVNAIQEAIPAIEQAAQAWRDLYDGESGREFKLEEHLQQRVSLIGTLGLIRDELAAVEREKNVRLLSTLNREIAAIVRDNPAPFIYERIGNRYRNLFIDEFQDTSITQWHNLIQLLNTWSRWTKWAWSWVTASRPSIGGETATTSSSKRCPASSAIPDRHSLTPLRHCGVPTSRRR